mmetsp:Transcript_10156/g.21197  ORF Transcript_10156/g.21197 Transcript_10156/m.21197 type:complete len:235 (+) Transcript_10156:452-1156(+)
MFVGISLSSSAFLSLTFRFGDMNFLRRFLCGVSKCSSTERFVASGELLLPLLLSRWLIGDAVAVSCLFSVFVLPTSPAISVMAIAAISSALTAVFSDDCSALTAARSAVLGAATLFAPLTGNEFVRALLPPFGESSDDDARDGMDPVSDGTLDIILFGFSADPCFKKVRFCAALIIHEGSFLTGVVMTFFVGVSFMATGAATALPEAGGGPKPPGGMFLHPTQRQLAEHLTFPA